MASRNESLRRTLMDPSNGVKPHKRTSISEEKLNLRIKCLEGKKEIRRLTKTIEDIQNQLTVTKNRLCYSNEKLLQIVAVGEALENSKGEEFVIITKKNIDEIEEKLEMKKEEIEKAKRDAVDKNNLLEGKRKEIEEFEKNEKREDKKIQALLEEKEEIKAEREINRKKISETKALIEVELNCKTSEKNALKKVLDEKEQKHEENEKKLKELEEKIKTKMTEIEEMNKVIKANEKMYEEKCEEAAKQDEHMQSLQHELKTHLDNIIITQREREEHREWLEQLKLKEIRLSEEKDKYMISQAERMKVKIKKIAKVRDENTKFEEQIKKAKRLSQQWK